MATKAKAKSTTKKAAPKKAAAKKSAPRKPAAKSTAQRASTASLDKYEQAGAPWWKRLPLPGLK